MEMIDIMNFINEKKCNGKGHLDQYDDMFFINRNEEGRPYWFYRDNKLGIAISECGCSAELSCELDNWKLDTLVRYLSSQALLNSLEDRLTKQIRTQRFAKIK